MALARAKNLTSRKIEILAPGRRAVGEGLLRVARCIPDVVADDVEQLAHLHIGLAAEDLRLGRIRVDLDGGGEFGQRGVEILGHRQHAAAIGVRDVHVGRVFGRRREIVERALERGFAQIKRAAVVIGTPEIEPLLQSEIVVGKRLIVLADALIGPAAHVEKDGIVRVGIVRSAVIGDRPLVVALSEIAAAADAECNGKVLAGRPGARSMS